MHSGQDRKRRKTTPQSNHAKDHRGGSGRSSHVRRGRGQCQHRLKVKVCRAEPWWAVPHGGTKIDARRLPPMLFTRTPMDGYLFDGSEHWHRRLDVKGRRRALTPKLDASTPSQGVATRRRTRGESLDAPRRRVLMPPPPTLAVHSRSSDRSLVHPRDGSHPAASW
jgi:hypothetical protein